MHVVVLGAGVVGVTTAYYLTERGHTVTVVDQADEVASGASGGNGGQLSYSFTDAMASPALLAKLPRVISGLDPAFCMRPPIGTLPVRWGLNFLSQCTSQRARSNTLAVLQMAMHSSSLMAELRSQVPLDFSFRRAGRLVLLSKPSELQAAEDSCEIKRQYGCDVRVITPEQATEIEPALAFTRSPFAGAVYSENDEVGNVLSFTSQLAQWLGNERNTEFQFNTTVHRIITEGGKLRAVETSNGTLKPDAVVVCLGAWSDRVFKPLGIRANIYPVRGYSVTLPAGDKSNSVSITDLGSKMVYSRLGDQIRIAGFADFVGYRTDRDEDRVRELLNAARNFAPDIADFDVSAMSEWGGFRPMTPDSRPVVGPSPVEGLYLNTGHGMLGWTLACVSGHELAELL
jgi:D-amino-acid dehydrogenase